MGSEFAVGAGRYGSCGSSEWNEVRQGVAMYEHRYICTNCTMGWHNTPYCPFPAPTVTIIRPLTDFERSKLARLDELEAAGVISQRGAQLFRGWWILPLVLALFFAILLIT